MALLPKSTEPQTIASAMFNANMIECQAIDTRSINDPRVPGGVVPIFVPGATFKGLLTELSSSDARIATATTGTEIKELQVQPTVRLGNGGIFRTVADGQFYRVVGTGDKTPPAASKSLVIFTVITSPPVEVQG